MTSPVNRVESLAEELELETMLLGRHLIPLRRPHTGDDRLLERSGYTLLSRIRVQGLMSISELSEALSLDVSTLNRQTAALTKSGYLERVADPEGGIARKFRVTQTGIQQLEADRRVNTTGLIRILSRWPEADVDQFVTLLRRFNSDIEALGGQPWPRGTQHD